MVLLDPERVLLSRLLTSGPLTTLPQPLLYYLALGFAALGLLLAGSGILGCWASCLHSYYMLTAVSVWFFTILFAYNSYFKKVYQLQYYLANSCRTLTFMFLFVNKY